LGRRGAPLISSAQPGSGPLPVVGSPGRRDYPAGVSLDPAARDVLVVVSLAVGVLGLLIGLVALLSVRRMRRDVTLLAADGDADSFLAAVARKTEEVQGLRREVDALSALLARTRTELADALRHVSVVRYDAFGDMGGRLSFSAALLDDGGDGLVLTSIHGRAETRSYIKGVKSGTSEASLSPEELQAIQFALRGTS
jgi:hypothetical protein